MSRIIKFRAWEPYNNRMVNEPYRFEPTPQFILEHPETADWEKMPFRHYETWQDIDDGVARPCYVMQFTGLLDKNGNEIFEGDVVRWIRKTGVVEYRGHGFWIDKESFGWEGESLWNWEQIEVVGNIYEHPELLNAKQPIN